MPSNRKKARRAIRAFLKNLSGENPDQQEQGVWACGAALYFEDLRVLLDSEREARRAAAVQSRKAAEAAQAAQRNQDAYLRERERTERGNVPLATQPDLRRLVEERGQKNRELTAERDRWQRTAEARGKDVRNLVAERDRLQDALNNLRDSVRKGTPPPPPFVSEPGGLSAEDLRKAAQFLETFFKGGKK